MEAPPEVLDVLRRLSDRLARVLLTAIRPQTITVA